MSGYLIQLGPVVYEQRGGQPFTLVQAMREVYGVGQARVLRTDGTVVVRYAGSAHMVEHAPSGRTVIRRAACRRSRWQSAALFRREVAAMRVVEIPAPVAVTR